MADYFMKVSPVTVMGEIQKKMTAFRELYGDNFEIHAVGKAIMTTEKTDPWISPRTNSIEVKTIGKQYISVIADGEVLKVNIKNPNHGINGLRFFKRE